MQVENRITRFFGPSVEQYRKSIYHISFIFLLFNGVLFLVNTFAPWPLYQDHMAFWFAEVLLYAFSAGLTNDTSTSLETPFVLKGLLLISLFTAFSPFYHLCEEAYTCNSFNSAEQAAITQCTADYNNNYIDVNSKLACANQINAGAAASRATGQCAFLLGTTAYANFVQTMEFLIIFSFAAKNLLLFYLVKIIYAKMKTSKLSHIKHRDTST